MGEQIDHFILIGHFISTRILRAGMSQLPTVAIVGCIIIVVRRNQPLMEFQVQAGVCPNQFVVTLQLFRISQRFHDGEDLLILLQTNQYVSIAHNTHIRLRIQRLQQNALDRHIFNAIGIKGSKQLA